MTYGWNIKMTLAKNIKQPKQGLALPVKNFIGITGAANGIGRELVKQLSFQGHHVVGLDIDKPRLVSLKKECGKLFSGIVCDLNLNNTKLNETLSKLKKTYGVPSVWINNAGITNIKTVFETTELELEQTMQINFFAAVSCLRFWLNHMETVGSGTIVNIGSVAGHISSPGLSAYVSSKFALTGFTQSLQSELELSKSLVKLILVSPGFVDTKMMHVGQKNGYPKELLFLATTAKDCAKHIINGIAKGDKEIFPGLNGKALMALYRISPSLARGVSKLTVGSRLDLSKK